MKKLICFVLIFCLLLGCTACGSSVKSPDTAEGTRIGYLSGTSSARYAAIHGTAKAYSSASELVSALKAGSIDCILADVRDAKSIKKGHLTMHQVEEPMAESNFRMAAALENPELVEQLNSALAALTDDGTLEEIISGCYADPDYHYDCEDVQDDSRVVNVLVETGFPPYCNYDSEGKICGIDIDVVRACCAWLGIACTFTSAPGTELIPAVKNGSYQLALGGITASSDMADYCVMTNPYAVCTQVILTY